MNILGINAYHGNASAALVCDGKLIAAVEEERFNRVKYAAGFPAAAIRYCLKEAGLTLADLDHVAVPRNPYARLGTKLFYALRMPSFARERAKVITKFTGIPKALAGAFDSDPAKIKSKFHRVEHHQAHLASTFFVSPFEQAALLLHAPGLAFGQHRHRNANSLGKIDPLEVHVQQVAFDGVVLPIHYHHRAALAALHIEIEDGVMAGLAVQDL